MKATLPEAGLRHCHRYKHRYSNAGNIGKVNVLDVYSDFSKKCAQLMMIRFLLTTLVLCSAVNAATGDVREGGDGATFKLTLVPAITCRRTPCITERMEPPAGRQLALVECMFKADQSNTKLPRATLTVGGSGYSAIGLDTDGMHLHSSGYRPASAKGLVRPVTFLFVVPSDVPGPFVYRDSDGTEIVFNEWGSELPATPLSNALEPVELDMESVLDQSPFDVYDFAASPVPHRSPYMIGFFPEIRRTITPEHGSLMTVSFLVPTRTANADLSTIDSRRFALHAGEQTFPCLYICTGMVWTQAWGRYGGLRNGHLLFNIPADIRQFDLRYGAVELKRIDLDQPPVAAGCDSGLRAIALKSINRKLDSIVIPSMEFPDIPPSFAIRILDDLSRNHDPEAGGITTIVGPSAVGLKGSLSLVGKNVTMREALGKLAEGIGRKAVVEPYAVLIWEGNPPSGVEVNSDDLSPDLEAIRRKLRELAIIRITSAQAAMGQLCQLLEKHAKLLDPYDAGLAFDPKTSDAPPMREPEFSDIFFDEPTGLFFSEDADKPTDGKAASRKDPPLPPSPRQAPQEAVPRDVSVSLSPMPFWDALRYICLLSGTQYRVTAEGVEIVYP